MKMGKLLVLILVFILILPSVSSIALSQDGNSTDLSKDNIIHELLRLRFNMGYLSTLNLGRYFVQQLRPPTPIQAYPESISLKYLNETTFQIGGKNPLKPLVWQPMVGVALGWSWAWMDKEIRYSFEFVPPDNTSKDIWNVQFDPEYLILKPNTKDLNWPGAETPFKTNVTIMLKPSVDPSIVTQDTVLKVNVVKEEVLDKWGLLKGAPEFITTHKEEYIQKCKELGEDPAWFYKTPSTLSEYNLLTKYFMFLANFRLPLVDKTVDSTVEILIKANKYHLAEVIAPLPLEIHPYEIISIPVSIKNIGSHIDTYNFRVNCSDDNIIIAPPPALTLKPGEEGYALVGVAAPKNFLSVGSTTSIFVDAYSVEDPQTVFSNTITLIISGIYVSGESTISSGLILIILFICLILILYFLMKRRNKICVKPVKPWKIPEEKEHLNKLKEKDKKEYNRTLEMMRDEYKSALLWYNNYCNYLLKENKKRKQKTQEQVIQKKLKEKAQEEEIKPEVIKKEEMVETEAEKEEPVIKPKVDRKAEDERRKKEKALAKVRRQQEKQRR